MKKIIAFLILFAVAFSGCGAENLPANDPAPAPSQSESENPSEGKTPEKADPLAGYYPAFGGSADYEGNRGGGEVACNPDGSFSFQDINKIHELSPENIITKTVTLSEEHLPGGYRLTWNGKYILAYGKSDDYSSWATVKYNEAGEMFISEASLFDREGNFITETADLAEGEEVYQSELYGIYWLSEDEIIVDTKHAVGLYNLKDLTGKLIHDMTYYVYEYGKSAVYYGSDGGAVFDGKYYYTEYKDGSRSLWVTDGETAKKYLDVPSSGEPNYLYCKDFITVTKRSDDGCKIYKMPYGSTETEFMLELEESHPNFLFSENLICINPDIVTDQGKMHKFFVYNTETGETEEFSLGMASQIEFDSFYKTENGYKLVYNSYEDGVYTFWIFDTAAGTNTALESFAYEYPYRFRFWEVSPDGKYGLKTLSLDYNEYVSAVKFEDMIPENPDIYPKNAEDFSEEALFYFDLVSENTRDELFSNIVLQQELLSEYSKIEHWHSLSKEELLSLSEEDGVFGVRKIAAANGNSSVYIIDTGTAFYNPRYFYIWRSGGESKLLHMRSDGFNDANLGELDNFIREDTNTLFLYTRTSLDAFDMATGEKLADFGPKFSFGNTFGDETEYQILGMGYDKKAETYVIAYTEWLFRDIDEKQAAVKFFVYNKSGEQIKSCESAGYIRYVIGNNVIVMASKFEVNAGEITAVFPTAQSETVITANYFELPNHYHGDHLFLETFGGTWRIDEGDITVSFYEKEGKPYIAYDKIDENYSSYRIIGAITEWEQVSEKEYSFWTRDKNNELTKIYINTGKSGDNKIKIAMDSEEFSEFNFEA